MWKFGIWASGGLGGGGECLGLEVLEGLSQPQLFCDSPCLLHKLIFFLLNWVKFMTALGRNVQLSHFTKEQYSGIQD